MNNNNDIVDDILDESSSNISKPQTSSNFQMPSDISEAYNESVNEIQKSKEIPQSIVTNTTPTEANSVTPPVQTVVTPPVQPEVKPTVTLVTEAPTVNVQEVNPQIVEQKQVEPVNNIEVTPVVEQVSVTPQVTQQAEQTSVLPVVENSVIPEKPVKKKGKALKIAILVTLLVITLSALAIYIIGIDTLRNYVGI